MTDYRAAHETWRAERRAALTAQNGWLTLVSRTPLAEGTHTVGSAEDNRIVLPVGPAQLATLVQHADGTVEVTPADGGATVRLVPSKKAPPRLTIGTLELELTTLNGENALRVRDTRSPAPGASRRSNTSPFGRSFESSPSGWPSTRPRRSPSAPARRSRTDVEATHSGSLHPRRSNRVAPCDPRHPQRAPVRLPRPDVPRRDLSGLPLRLWRGGDRAHDRHRLQQGDQPALRLHGVRHLPAAAAGETSSRSGSRRVRSGQPNSRSHVVQGTSSDTTSPAGFPGDLDTAVEFVGEHALDQARAEAAPLGPASPGDRHSRARSRARRAARPPGDRDAALGVG